jgi:hypothetical protein
MPDHAPETRRFARRPLRPAKEPARPAPRGASEPHEWETERWKHQVEAEARSRLKKELRGEEVR